MDKDKEFINDLIEVYKKHNLSLSHEDTQGGFLIEDISDWNINWLMEARRKRVKVIDDYEVHYTTMKGTK